MSEDSIPEDSMPGDGLPEDRSATGEPATDADSAVEEEPGSADVAAALEALLLVADEPVGIAELAAALSVSTSVVEQTIAELSDFYALTGRGFELREVAGGWRYYTRPEHHELIARHLLEGQQARLSQAALETLAVIAYQQPISRARVAAVRGVSVDGVVRTLLTRGLIAESGLDRESGATLFGTTSYFLERLGLRNLEELPPLAPHLPAVADLEAELTQLAVAAETSAASPESEEDHHSE